MFGLCALLLGACASGGEKADTSSRSPEEQRKYEEAIARGEVKIGMTEDEVARTLGKPLRVDTTKYIKRDVVRWSYTFNEIYFRHGYVVGWRGP